jgi:hypothetical protein
LTADDGKDQRDQQCNDGPSAHETLLYFRPIDETDDRTSDNKRFGARSMPPF